MPGDFTFTDQVAPVCEIGFGSTRADEPTSWFDASCYVHEAELFRGRERFNERFQPGTASITFDNRSGWGDLVGDPYAVADAPLRPGRPIRIGMQGPWGEDGATITRWMWRGWIDQAQPEYHPTLHDIVTANCIDALGEAGQTVAPLGPLVGVNETVDQRINRALDAVGWFSTKRAIAESGTGVTGTTLGAPAIDLMSVAADSSGGVVYGDTEGNIVYKERNWAYYDPDLAHDGEIGNCDPGTPPIPDSPPYLDPTPGPVYDPNPPIDTAPPTIDVCVTGAPVEGTVVEQGDAWRIFIHDGHLWYESSGHLWDMGVWTSANQCTSIGTGGTPSRTDPGVAPFDGSLVAWPFNIELLGYSDGGLDDGPQSIITVTGLAPGADCMLVVMINALCDAVGSGSLAPYPVNGGSVNGGGLTFEKIGIDEKSGFDGAEAYAVAADVGRTDPGIFDLIVDWSGDHQSRSHIVTVWKVTGHKKDMFARMKASAYLHGGTHDQPESVLPGGPPGKGETTFNLISADFAGLPTDFTRMTDVVIAQSLAESPNPPFGAEFGAGTWWTPFSGLGGGPSGEWTDDFERTDLGPDWILGLYTTPATSLNETLHLPTLVGGAAVGPIEAGAPIDVTSFARTTGTAVNQQSIEIEVEDLWQSTAGYGFQIELGAYVDPVTGIAWVAQFIWNDGDAAAQVTAQQYIEPGTLGFSNSTTTIPAGGGTTTLRLDSYATGQQVISVNGAVVLDFAGDIPIAGGTQQSIFMFYKGAGADSPQILRATGGGGIVRKCSWVAGYRFNTSAPDVEVAEVNDGPDDIQSTQGAVTIESGEDIGFAWRTLGYRMIAPATGALSSGSTTLTIHPERTGIILVAVGAFADPEMASTISISSNHLTFSTVRTQATDTVGWAQGRLFAATLNNFPIDNSDPPTVTIAWTIPVQRIGLIIYEVANAQAITASTSIVRGTHVSGSANGSATATLSPPPTTNDVSLGFLIGSDVDFNETGSTPITGFNEELNIVGLNYMWLSVESQVASTSGTIGYADLDASPTSEALDAILFGVVVTPLPDFAVWSSADPLMVGGARDAFGGRIFSAIGKAADGTSVWAFDASLPGGGPI